MKRMHRLTSPRDFRRVFERGRRASDDGILCVAAAGGADRPPRAGVVTGRALGGAVARNRAKRRARAILRPLVREIPSGVDVVVTVKPEATGKTFQEMERSITVALKRAVGQ